MTNRLPLSLMAILLTGLVGCPSSKDEEDPDSGGDEALVFEEELVLSPVTGELNEPDPESEYFYPLHHNFSAAHLIQLEAPDTPYEIRGFSAGIVTWETGWASGIVCDSQSPLEIFVHVGDEYPVSLGEFQANDPGSLPSTPSYTASMQLTGEGEYGDVVAYELLEGTLQESVVVESGEVIWLGIIQTTQPSQTHAACPQLYEGSDRRSESFGKYLRYVGDWTSQSGEWVEADASFSLMSVTLGI